MISRRRVLSGLICAPAIIKSANAQFFMPRTFNPSAGVGSVAGSQFLLPNMTQVKPNGIPSINWNHPLTNGLLVYMFDLGNGQYINLCEGNRTLTIPYGDAHSDGVPQAIKNGATNYGVASLWPGATVQANFAQPGLAQLIQVNLGDVSIPNANDLTTKGIGAGNTLACAVIRQPGNVNASYEWIFGRPGVSAGEVSPLFDWCFVQQSNNNIVQAYCLQGPGVTQTQVGNNYSCPDNVYTSFLMTCQNTSASPGTGPATFAVNGIANGITTGVSMFSYNPATAAETDLMVGCTKHIQTTETVNVWAGYIPWGAVYKRSLKPPEWMYLHNHPYVFLQ